MAVEPGLAGSGADQEPALQPAGVVTVRARTHFDATVMAAGYERLYRHLCWEVRKQQVIAPARAGAPAGIAQGVGPGCR